MSASEIKPLAISLMGPTASGKTDLAMLISKEFPVEVISVDSALIYRGMDIGTAKPGAEFLRELPHFLVDIRDPDEAYSVAEFRRDALKLMQEIQQRGNIPLLVGGTMLYFKALQEGLADLPATDPEIRAEVGEQAAQLGWPAMHEKLRQVDPVTAEQLHPNHSQRIQRALEVYLSCGEAMSALQAKQVFEPSPFDWLQLALWPDDRTLLHQRIELRFKAMLANDFLAEVEHLRERFELDCQMMSMRAVGYRQAWGYLEGEYAYNEMFLRGIAATRQLAKRQLTWLRKWPDLVQLEVNFSQPNPLGPLMHRIAQKIAERKL